MKNKLAFLLMLSICFFTIEASAQKTVTKKTTFVKFKPPKLFTTLGILKDSSLVPVEQAKAVIGNKMVVNDLDKKGTYTVQSYQFIYRKRTVSEDEQGKAYPTTSISSQSFTDAGPLPEIWSKTIREDLKPGEELYFFDIIIKDNLGRIMYAPDLKIITR